jgi:hypothetical protein
VCSSTRTLQVDSTSLFSEAHNCPNSDARYIVLTEISAEDLADEAY